jgi:Lipocalin-like domain
MKFSTICFFLLCALFSCESGQNSEKPAAPVNPMIGTWELISGTTVQGKDTTITDYTKNKKFIKIINGSHFAFVGHDLAKGKDSLAFYTSGAGTYTLTDSTYTEHLQFCSDRAWEGTDFTFHVLIQNDSLTQTGVEKVEKIGVNRLNIEKYARLKN